MTKYLIKEKDFVEKLNTIKKQMEELTKSGDLVLDGSLNYLFATGGKMVRPSLMLIGSMFSKKSKKNQDIIIDVATAIEAIHLATLVHDDVIDQSDMRRNQLSVQAKYGQSYAVYMGDYLLSQCFLMLSHLDLDKEVFTRIAKCVNQICLGDMKQHQMKFDLNITLDMYLRMVSKKTAALISLSLAAGSYLSKASDETSKLLGKIGYEIGMIFQLVDDLLDYEGDKNVVGKDVQMDVIKGYYSSPIIFALQSDTEYASQLRVILSKELTEEDFEEIYKIVIATESIKKTRELVQRYYKRVQDLIVKLPNGKGKDYLNELIPKLVNRVM